MGQISRSNGSSRSTGSEDGSFGCELAVSEIGWASPAAARGARRFPSYGAILALLAGMSLPLHVAMAQEDDQEDASAPEAEEQPARSQLEEMTVTASRNEESVKEVPISVTTVPQQQIISVRQLRSPQLLFLLRDVLLIPDSLHGFLLQ